LISTATGHNIMPLFSTVKSDIRCPSFPVDQFVARKTASTPRRCTVCKDKKGIWRWALAEPTVDRWGSLQ
jgi:hypothetical protein